MRISTKGLIIVFLFVTALSVSAVDGSQLWLERNETTPVTVVCSKGSKTLDIAKEELVKGWKGAANSKITFRIKKDNKLKNDGFRLESDEIISNSELGILYGVFDMLRRQQIDSTYKKVLSNPSYKYRILDHWDNQNGSIERGYAGKSIFWRAGADQFVVTDADKARWSMYARANASVGINGAVLNNVNSNPSILNPDYLKRTAAIAEVLRPFGVKVFLSINFASPQRLGKLKSSDPLDPEVIAWWTAKVKEVYQLIPDFGGFLVKANSEGQSGPQDYGRTHADGANMLADALKPFGGIVMWRAFVYSPKDDDRAMQAYNEFMPFDGKFRDNVIIQVKNGPIDFQPREPFSPLFGSMTKTPVMPELQITQEYLGHSHQLVYLGTMWEELLKSDTYKNGPGSTVAKCTDGSLSGNTLTAIAGVSNIGLDVNWCGNVFAPSNWYAFGRLAWENSLSSEMIADEWLRQTFQYQQAKRTDRLSDRFQYVRFIKPMTEMMMQTREAAVSYMMPLGLHHIFSPNEHYGPGPWYGPARTRKDWTSLFYHKADTLGIGFNRTLSGSKAVSQYFEPLSSMYNNPKTCPENVLLWFHHLPWKYIMKDGHTLWDALCFKYDSGVKSVRTFQKTWNTMESYVDAARFADVQKLLQRQARDAQYWKDACILYFQQFSRMPIPYEVDPPMYDLDFLMKYNTLQPYKLEQ